MSKLRTDFKDEILQEGETHRVYNIKRKGTDEVVESEVYLEKAYEALQEGDEFGAKDVNEIHVRLNGLASMNLLINSDFRNPINQRGETSYTSSNVNKYTIDRWCFNPTSNDKTLTVNDGYITLQNSGSSNLYLLQPFEKALPQDTYTLSINVKSISGSGDVLINGVGVWLGELKVGLNSLTVIGSPTSIQLTVHSNSTLELYWAKLEQGSIATPFVPRPYGEELALCQRYYLIMVETCMIITRQRFDSNISYYPGFVLPNEVRTVGTATYESRTPDGIVLTGELQAIIDRGCVNYFNIWGDYPNVEITKFVIDAEIY